MRKRNVAIIESCSHFFYLSKFAISGHSSLFNHFFANISLCNAFLSTYNDLVQSTKNKLSLNILYNMLTTKRNSIENKVTHADVITAISSATKITKLVRFANIKTFNAEYSSKKLLCNDPRWMKKIFKVTWSNYDLKKQSNCLDLPFVFRCLLHRLQHLAFQIYFDRKLRKRRVRCHKQWNINRNTIN